jgi:Cu-Zn family superoxide dismutase
MQHNGTVNIDKNTQPEVKKAIAVLFPAPNGKVKGIVTFTATSDGKLKVVADVEGLTPGKHGFHIHEYGDCSSNDFNSAGPHYSTGKEPHGAPTSDNRHTGDMGNITAESNGKAHMEWTDTHMKLTGANSIVGRAVVVHGGEDDLKSQPAGNSGPRVACGVIGVMK